MKWFVSYCCWCSWFLHIILTYIKLLSSKFSSLIRLKSPREAAIGDGEIFTILFSLFPMFLPKKLKVVAGILETTATSSYSFVRFVSARCLRLVCSRSYKLVSRELRFSQRGTYSLALLSVFKRGTNVHSFSWVYIVCYSSF